MQVLLCKMYCSQVETGKWMCNTRFLCCMLHIWLYCELAALGQLRELILNPVIMATILLFTVTWAAVCKLHSFYQQQSPHNYKNRKFHELLCLHYMCAWVNKGRMHTPTHPIIVIAITAHCTNHAIVTNVRSCDFHWLLTTNIDFK